MEIAQLLMAKKAPFITKSQCIRQLTEKRPDILVSSIEGSLKLHFQEVAQEVYTFKTDVLRLAAIEDRYPELDFPSLGNETPAPLVFDKAKPEQPRHQQDDQICARCGVDLTRVCRHNRKGRPPCNNCRHKLNGQSVCQNCWSRSRPMIQLHSRACT